MNTKRYTVECYEVYRTDIEVEAKDEEDAQKKAEKCFETGILPDGEPVPEGKYSYTMDCSDWVVWES